MATESPRNATTAALVLLLTFVGGGVTGAGIMFSFGPGRHHRPPTPGERRLPPHFDQLELTAEQRAKVEAIFEVHRPKFEAVFAESWPRLQAERDAMDAEVLPLLTAEQRVKFEEMKKRHAERPRGGFGMPPPPPPAP